MFADIVLWRAFWDCERCGQMSKNLHPHHLWTRARGGPDEAWNGAAVCFRCHREIHDGPDNDWLASSETEARAIRARLDGRKG